MKKSKLIIINYLLVAFLAVFSIDTYAISMCNRNAYVANNVDELLCDGCRRCEHCGHMMEHDHKCNMDKMDM